MYFILLIAPKMNTFKTNHLNKSIFFPTIAYLNYWPKPKTMKSRYTFFLAFTILLTHYKNAGAQQPNINQIVRAMSLEEKAALVVGAHTMPGNDGLLKKEDRVPGAAGHTYPLSRLHIPPIYFADGSSGLVIGQKRQTDTAVNYYTTKFPTGTLLASSWDAGLLRQVGNAIGNEAKQYGVDVLLAPAINIQRNPLGGRNYEYYSEDPLLTGKLASAMIQGIQQNQVGATIKHFAGNNQETDRHNINSVISQRALREIYLKGFEIAIRESRPWLVMSSYNKLNGTYTAENKDLLESVLRKDWNFSGFVISDWFGGKDDIQKLTAGNDLIMPGNPQQPQAIVDAVKTGKLSMAQLDRNVSRILKVILNTGSFKKTPRGHTPDLAAHAKLARIAAAEGMVLLKNEQQTLPIKRGQKVALFGSYGYAANLFRGSDQKYQQNIAGALASAGYLCTTALKSFYEQFITERRAAAYQRNRDMSSNEPMVSKEMIDAQGQEADMAIITISHNNKMGQDKNVDTDFNLTATEKELIKNVSEKFRLLAKKVVVILNVGCVVETASWRDQADGILLAWQPGLEGGNAIADVLTGNVNPSGKLAASLPVKYSDVPSAADFGSYNNAVYHEGIYVGYRYYTTFNVATAYPFGFGLSYTRFNYDHLKVYPPVAGRPVKISFRITNTGPVAGKEVAEIYVSAPKSAIDKPKQELKAFAKTKLLKPGESQLITLTINTIDLASFQTGISAWVADKGAYTIMASASSTDIKLKGVFVLKQQLTKKVSDVLKTDDVSDELKQNDF